MLKHVERLLKRFAAATLRLTAPSSPQPLPKPDDVRRVLIVRQHNQLGDMLCVVPMLRSLRAAYPRAHLTLLTSPVNHDVMIRCRYVDDVRAFDKRRFIEAGRVHGLALVEYVRSLRREGFDLVVAPATVSLSFTTDLLVWLTRARVRCGVGELDGTPNPSSALYTHRAILDWRESPGRHQTLRHFDVAAALPGVTAPADLSPEITLADSERTRGAQEAAALRGPHRLLLALHPGAGKPPNRWPADRFAAVAERLASAWDAAIVITAGPMDDEQVAGTAAALAIPYTVLRRRPIREVAAVLAHADLLISNDTGIMHVGAAAGAPVLSLFGPTPAAQWAPVGPQHRSLQGEGGNIESIPVEAVAEAATAMLSRRGVDER